MKKVVILGGGSGLSNILRSIKEIEVDLSVFVAVSDNGGSTGKIRKYYNVPAPGDLRRAVLALSDDDKIEDLMNFRFDENIDNHTVGNLILAALIQIEDDVEKAVQRYCNMIGITRNIYPISKEDVTLSAILENGEIIHGERQMNESQSQIRKVFYDNGAKATQRAIEKIKEADYIILSAGSLYTSILSNLVYENIIEELKRNKGKIVYIANIMSEIGETEGYALSDHINAINEHFEESIIDYVFANSNTDIDVGILKSYELENSELIRIDAENIDDVEIISNDYVEITENNHLRHNTKLISQDLMKLFMEE